jgi:hypothetical protein
MDDSETEGRDDLHGSVLLHTQARRRHSIASKFQSKGEQIGYLLGF